MNKFAACFAASSVAYCLSPGPAWSLLAIITALNAAAATYCLIDAIREKP